MSVQSGLMLGFPPHPASPPLPSPLPSPLPHLHLLTLLSRPVVATASHDPHQSARTRSAIDTVGCIHLLSTDGDDPPSAIPALS